MQSINCASTDQNAVIDQVFTHHRSHNISNNTDDQLLLFVTGGTGAGKSFFIRLIKEMQMRTQVTHNPVLLTAPTGIAAYNIGSVTVYSVFCLWIEHQNTANYVPLKSEKLKQFKVKFKNIAFLIIDEISMSSCQNFAFMHKCLCDIKNTTNGPTKLFGNISIIAFGDVFQLKPVHGNYIFDTRRPESYLWRKFDVALLTTNHRQAKDKIWAEILNRIHTGQPTDADIEILTQRTSVNTSIPPFDTALRIFPTHKQVKVYNEQYLNHLTSENTTSILYSITAQDDETSALAYLTEEQILQSKPTNESETAGLAETLNLAQGSRIMLIHNVYTDEGLVNEAQGTVEGTEWGDDNHNIPRGIYAKFDNPSIGRTLKMPLTQYIQKLC